MRQLDKIVLWTLLFSEGLLLLWVSQKWEPKPKLTYVKMNQHCLQGTADSFELGLATIQWIVSVKHEDPIGLKKAMQDIAKCSQNITGVEAMVIIPPTRKEEVLICANAHLALWHHLLGKYLRPEPREAFDLALHAGNARNLMTQSIKEGTLTQHRHQTMKTKLVEMRELGENLNFSPQQISKLNQILRSVKASLTAEDLRSPQAQLKAWIEQVKRDLQLKAQPKKIFSF